MSVLSGRVIVGDAATELARLPATSVDMVLTSPPYFRLRDYRVAGQLGLEPHVDQWVGHLRAVSAEIARVLLPTGSFWLNLADTYSTHMRQGAARKCLLLGPERLLLALARDGWLVRNKIVWAKTNAMPVSVRDRLSCTNESLYLLTRSPDYFFDLDAIRIPQTSTRRPAVGSKPRARTSETWPDRTVQATVAWLPSTSWPSRPPTRQEPRRRLAARHQRLPRSSPRHLPAHARRTRHPRRQPGSSLHHLPPTMAQQATPRSRPNSDARNPRTHL